MWKKYSDLKTVILVYSWMVICWQVPKLYLLKHFDPLIAIIASLSALFVALIPALTLTKKGIALYRFYFIPWEKIGSFERRKFFGIPYLRIGKVNRKRFAPIIQCYDNRGIAEAVKQFAPEKHPARQLTDSKERFPIFRLLLFAGLLAGLTSFLPYTGRLYHYHLHLKNKGVVSFVPYTQKIFQERLCGHYSVSLENVIIRSPALIELKDQVDKSYYFDLATENQTPIAAMFVPHILPIRKFLANKKQLSAWDRQPFQSDAEIFHMLVRYHARLIPIPTAHEIERANIILALRGLVLKGITEVHHVKAKTHQTFDLVYAKKREIYLFDDRGKARGMVSLLFNEPQTNTGINHLCLLPQEGTG